MAVAIKDEEVSAEVAQFIAKVWSIVNSSDTNHLVKWTENGKTFAVIDEVTFSKEILPHYFKHNNFASFVRQLNLYGFRKVAKPDQGALVKSKNEQVEFWHANFRRNHPELLHLVQRRAVSSRTGMEEKNPFISQVINDIHQMKGRHESIDVLMNDLKRENSHLRQEITILKEKHKYQHKLLNKIIHFIVHILYKGRLPTSGRKTSQLMLTDGEDAMLMPKPKRSKVSTTDPISILYDVESPPPSATFSYSPPVSAGASTGMTSLQNQFVNAIHPPVTLPSASDTTHPQQQHFSISSLPNEPINDDFLAGLLSEPLDPIPPQTHIQDPIPPQTHIQDPIPPQIHIQDPIPPQIHIQDPVPPKTHIQDPIPSHTYIQDPVLPKTHIQDPVPPLSTVSPTKTSSLVPYTEQSLESDGKCCPINTLNCHLDNQEQDINSLHEMLPSQLSIDPTIMSEFLNTDFILPEYDLIDTARLLESISSKDPQSDVPHEQSVQNAIVPYTEQNLFDLLSSVQ